MEIAKVSYGSDPASRVSVIPRAIHLTLTGQHMPAKDLTLRVAPDGIRASELRCVVQALGHIEGSGTIASGFAGIVRSWFSRKKP